MAKSKRRRNRRRKPTSTQEPNQDQPTEILLPDTLMTSQRTEEQVEQLLDQTENLTVQHQQLERQEQDLSELHQTIKDASVKTRETIAKHNDRLLESFETKIENMMGRLGKQLDQFSTSDGTALSVTASSDADDQVSVSDADSNETVLSGWEQQKQQMYAAYGENHEPSVAAGQHDEVRSSDVMELSDESKEQLESLHDSIDSIESIEAEEIEDLRVQLTEKLREAEIEISINRAKLDQKSAELERRQNELERREVALTKKYGNMTGPAQKRGILDRLTQHLTLRKRTDFN